MQKQKNIRINRLTQPVPEYRLDEMRSLLEFYDMPVILSALIKYMPEQNYRLMLEDLSCAQNVVLEERAVFEEGGLPGRGALKILVNKSPDQDLSPSECDKIGKIIASMEGEPKKYYVGMMNFLGAACRIHHEIKTSYMNSIRKRAQGGAPEEQVPDAVFRMFPGNKPPTQAEIKKREEEEIERLKQLNDKVKNEQPVQQQAKPEGAEQAGEEYESWAKKRAGLQQEEQPQEEQPKEQPQQAKAETPKPAPEVKEAPAPEPATEPKKKKPPKQQFKQYVPQLQISKGFTQIPMNRMMKK